MVTDKGDALKPKSFTFGNDKCVEANEGAPFTFAYLEDLIFRKNPKCPYKHK